MSKTKRFIEDYIADLSKKSGYGYCELMDIWWAYCDDCYDDNEDINYDYFTSVTMERDW